MKWKVNALTELIFNKKSTSGNHINAEVTSGPTENRACGSTFVNLSGTKLRSVMNEIESKRP